PSSVHRHDGQEPVHHGGPYHEGGEGDSGQADTDTDGRLHVSLAVPVLDRTEPGSEPVGAWPGFAVEVITVEDIVIEDVMIEAVVIGGGVIAPRIRWLPATHRRFGAPAFDASSIIGFDLREFT